MKKTTLIILVLVVTMFAGPLTSCGSKGSDQKQTDEVPAAASDEETVYACPMHPEITGKAGDDCSKCGMALEKAEHEHDEHD